MIIDMAAHILPPRFFDAMLRTLPTGFYQEKRIRSVPGLLDVDMRLRVIESFSAFGYRQVLSPSAPPVERVASPEQSPELCRLLNEELAALAQRHPHHFVAAMGTLPLNNPDASLKEIDHLVELGLVGCKVGTNVNGVPLDHPTLLPVIEELCRRGLIVFLHPVRDRNVADYPTEDSSKYEIWVAIGWPYETTAAMIRLVFGGLFKRCPDATIFTHHLGGMVPYFAARLRHVYDQFGTRTPGENYEDLLAGLPEHPVDSLRRFYGDTALNGGPAAVACGVDFHGPDHVLFGTDVPFDGQGGSAFIRLTMDAVERTGLSPQAKNAIFAGNARRLLGSRLGSNLAP